MTKRTAILALLFLVFLGAQLHAQFGKNIVQYDNYKWKFIQSPHFDIYFYGDDVTLAEYTAKVADEAYLHISDRLNWEIQKRVSIMVYRSHSDFQQTNVVFSFMQEGIGGVTELFKNRVVVPFEGSYDDFYHVIRHELVHAVVNDLIYGGNIQSVVNGSIRYSIPLWMNEGLAEYLSTDWNATADMYMRDLAINGEIPPIRQLGGLYAYHGGKSVWTFITSKYGEEVIAEIFSQIRSRGNVEKGLEAATGMDYKELHEQWKEYLKKQYWPDVTGRDRIKDVAHQVTNHVELKNSYNIAPSISPDGSKLAALVNNYSTMEIILLSATDGRFLKTLLKGGTKSDFEELHLLKPGITWSPDGEKVAFAAKAGREERLYVIDIKSGKTEKYTAGLEGIYMATWSPDSTTIAFVGNDGMASNIFLLDLETEKVTNLTDDVFGEFNPAWSPDGSQLVFSSDRGSYPPFRYDSDGRQYEFVTRFDPILGEPLSSVKPGFTRDGYDFSRKGIFLINRDGSGLRPLRDTAEGENYPVFTSSAPYVLYTSDRSGIANIYMANLETGDECPVTNVLNGVSDLNMAVDDSRLYFTAFYDQGYDIYRIHNPVELWDSPKEVPLSNYLKVTGETRDVNLVNRDRDVETTVAASDYSRYVFGFDEPGRYDSETVDSLTSVVLTEDSIRDEQGRPLVHPYRTRFTLDLVQSYAGYSTVYNFQGMTQFMFSDMLGNHRISLATEMQISLDNSDYYVTYHLLPYRTNYYFTLFHTAFLYASSNYERRRFRHYGFDITASTPLSRFRRIDLGATLNTVEYTVFKDFHGDYNYEEIYKISLPTIIPRIGYVWDNTEWSYMYPVRGWRANMQLEVSPSWGENGITFQTVSLDIRRYFRLFGGTSFAARLAGGASYGEDAQGFLAGGLPWLFSNEEGNFEGSTRYKRDIFTSDNRENLKLLYYSKYMTPLRGTQMMEQVGTQAALLNLEYRFPFLIYYFPALRMLGQIGGVLFVDSGAAWDEGDRPKGILTYGWGPRFILFGLPLQLDYATQYKPDPGDPAKHWYLTIGLDF
ncbi:MAG: PD40 domain-containing protein [Candidatus Marinimicrobia bacterium]|nr:PD40 domain-containing protein [Candidatus Neomarinimicrobiota bacterium]